MTTSISDKEKKVLIFLGIFVLIFFYGYFFFKPKYAEIKDLKAKISEYKEIYEINLQYKEGVRDIDSDLKILKEKQKNIWEILPPYMNYDEVILIIKDAASKSKVSVSNMEFQKEKLLVDESKEKEVPDENTEETSEETTNRGRKHRIYWNR